MLGLRLAQVQISREERRFPKPQAASESHDDGTSQGLGDELYGYSDITAPLAATFPPLSTRKRNIPPKKQKAGNLKSAARRRRQDLVENATEPARRQRTLGPAPTSRPNEYDILSEDPQLAPKQWLDPAPEVSPLRNQRTTAHEKQNLRGTREPNSVDQPGRLLNSIDSAVTDEMPRQIQNGQNLDVLGSSSNRQRTRSVHGVGIDPASTVAKMISNSERPQANGKGKTVSGVHLPRASEMYSRTSGDEESANSSEEEVARKQTKRKRSTSTVDHGNRSQKIKKKKNRASEAPDTSQAVASHVDASDVDASQVDTSQVDTFQADAPQDTNRVQDSRRLLGRWNTLQKIFAATKDVGVVVHKGREVNTVNDIKLTDPDIKLLIALCTQAQQTLEGMQASGHGEQPKEFPKIQKCLRKLCSSNPKQRREMEKSIDIYAHLIPNLVKLLQSTVECYVAIDRRQETGGRTVTTEHLRIILSLIKSILDMGTAAKEYVRPDPNLCIVKPVKNHIIVPLREVDAAFRDHVRRQAQAQENSRRIAAEEEEEDRRWEYEEVQRRREAEERKHRAKWKLLHNERSACEPGFKDYAKQMHLCYPGDYIEIDPDGEPFERVQIFGTRVGPPPGLVERARRQRWSDAEIEALCQGLQDFEGPNVFEMIFRQYCQRGRVLNKYNVTEIVTQATDVKELLEKEGFDDEWVKAIPIWTRRRVLAGQENSTENLPERNDDE